MSNEPIVIYYAEDDEEDRTMFRDCLEETGMNVKLVEFNNGVQLLNHLNSKYKPSIPCIIVSDIKMPAMDGPELLRNLKKHETYKTIPVIMLSTSSNEFDRNICLELGARAFFTKPNTLNEIRRTVREIISICHDMNGKPLAVING